MSRSKAQGDWDDHACFHFSATAKVNVPLDELYEALTRPEMVSALATISRPDLVFVSAPMTPPAQWENHWTASNPPSGKIIEWCTTWGRSGPPTCSWVEYGFNAYSHVIDEHSLGSISERSICQPYRDAEYHLSPVSRVSAGPASTVRYTSTECIPREERNRFANERESRIQLAKKQLSDWLEAAADVTAAAKERAKKPPPKEPLAPRLTITPLATLPTATATPAVFSPRVP